LQFGRFGCELTFDCNSQRRRNILCLFMFSGRINRKGKLERDPTNRNLNPDKHDEVRKAFKWSEGIDRKKQKKQEEARKRQQKAERLQKAEERKSVTNYTVMSSHDIVPSDKFADQSRHLFKGKTFLQAALKYPLVLEKFLKGHRHLFSPKALSEIMAIVTEQKAKLDPQSFCQ
jgi:hypothetical protein